MTIEKLKPTFSLEQDLVEQLKQLIPEAVADGKINWETLKEVLGEHLEEEGVEHFGLNWSGKRQARRLASMPSKGTLVPVPGEGIDEETTGNIFIEGDNLEVLKILQKSYAARVKLIYIDPPYNTGNDFIYKDDYREVLEDYLKKTSQMDNEGNMLTSNPKSSGRFHSNWLNMIYPRLLLSRNLLREDGALWISIDDGECQHLRLICNELFGEENFIATFLWEKRTTRENRRVFSFNHDYILCYAKDKDAFQASRNLLPLTEEALERYSNPDNDPRGDWQSVSLNAQAGHATRNQFYTIQTPSGRKIDPPPGRCWSVTKDRLQELISDDRIWFGKDGNNVPRRKIFKSEADLGLTPHTLWKADEVGTNDSAKKALIELFQGESIFDTPKSVELIKRIVHISTNQDDIILDFFAGSCTTAQAVMELNRNDGGKRQFILVQLPEPTNNSYASIAEIGKERIRRVIKKINEEDGKLQLNVDDKNNHQGFRNFKYNQSNIKVWENYKGDDIQAFQTLLFNFENTLIEGWKETDLVTEIQLLEGFPLDSNIEQASEFSVNYVYKVNSEYIDYRLFICLEKKLNSETIEHLNFLASEDVFICLDNALTDEAKLQLSDGCNVKTI